jgi:hypothetical protein
MEKIVRPMIQGMQNAPALKSIGAWVGSTLRAMK